MRNISFIIIIACLSLFSSVSLNAQDGETLKSVETTEFEVTGVCGMCKDRIEAAALGTKGVKLATWDQETQMLKVIYKTSKTNLNSIKQSVADAGHDTDTIKADDEAYAKLPACCAYRDGIDPHR